MYGSIMTQIWIKVEKYLMFYYNIITSYLKKLFECCMINHVMSLSYKVQNILCTSHSLNDNILIKST